MKKSRAILGGPFIVALAGIIFCVWSALGNDVNFCVTTGCTLYQDFNIAGISLWWFGTTAFLFLAACALFGLPILGKRFAALFLGVDVILLLLMVLTAPCTSCLIVASLLALSYWTFRKETMALAGSVRGKALGLSVLLLLWLALFTINLGYILKSQIEIWPILDESGEARGRMFFSPSCRYCIEGIKILAGNVNMAFYPVAETEEDIFQLLKMRELLNDGENLSEALANSADAIKPGFFASLRPDILYFRFRLLCNKAHVYAAGSRGIPFFEYLGLPPEVRKQIEMQGNEDNNVLKRQISDNNSAQQRDSSLPIELWDGQCKGGEPCPPAPY